MPVLERDGCRLAYEVRGDGPPVVFIQGVGVAGSGWTPQVDALAGRYRCLTFDNRGMGGSGPAGGRLSIATMAEDALALMDGQGWETAHVVGHSMGGPIALQVALSAPERVRSLSLLCTFARGRDATELSVWLVWTGLLTRVGPRRLRRRAFLRILMPPGEPPAAERDAMAERLAPLFGHDLAVQPPVAMDQLAALRAYDATPRLGELAGVPTLVVSATHDRIAKPKSGKALAAGIPGARYVEVPDAAHGVPIHRAEAINGLLAEHLGSAEAARAGGGDGERVSGTGKG